MLNKLTGFIGIKPRMKKAVYISFVTILFVQFSGITVASNLLSNGDFEAGLQDWLVYDDASGFTATVVTDSANVGQGSKAVRLYKPNSSGDGCIHRDDIMIAWQGSNAMKVCFRIKDDPTLKTGESVRVVIASSDTYDLGGYNNFEVTIVKQAGVNSYSYYEQVISGFPESTQSVTMNIRLSVADGTLADGDVFIDDIQIYDLVQSLPPIINADMNFLLNVLNGGFESDLELWDVFDSGSGFTATVVDEVSNVAQGGKALRICMPNPGDGCIHKDNYMFPWLGSRRMRVSFRIKDDITLTTGEYVKLHIAASDNADLSGFNGYTHNIIRGPGNGQFNYYEEILTDIPASTESITVNVSLTDISGASRIGDVFVDDICIYDADVPSIPPIYSGFNDINSDSVNDTLYFQWNNKPVLFVSDSGQLPWPDSEESRDWEAYFDDAYNTSHYTDTWNPIRGTWGGYTILVDRDNSGRFDDTGDFYYKCMDLNSDGEPDAEFLVPFPGAPTYSGKFHVNFNGEPEMSFLDWNTFFYPDEQSYAPGYKFYMNVHGSGLFTNSYRPVTLTSWETPIAWYDFDCDGKTNFVMRTADTFPDAVSYPGKLSEGELAFELNSNLSEDLWFSIDLQLTYVNYGNGCDITQYIDTIPEMKGLDELEGLIYSMKEHHWQENRIYTPYMDGYRVVTEYPDWAGVYLFFDEDGDDSRWEEMFSVHESWNPVYADRIGDRFEGDSSFAGSAKLYIGKFDRRIHLYKADQGFWEIDYLGLFLGSADREWSAYDGPEPTENMRYPQVRYFDIDGNGFIDKIEYSTVAYKHEDTTRQISKVINLLDYADDEVPHPDVCSLYDPRVPEVAVTGWDIEGWDKQPLEQSDFEGTPVKAGFDKMYNYYGQVCDLMWSDATKLYNLAVRHGWNRSQYIDVNLKTSYTLTELAQLTELTVPQGYSRLLNAVGRREKYNNGFWLKEKVFEDIVTYSSLNKEKLEKYYYTGNIDALCSYADSGTQADFNGDGKVDIEDLVFFFSQWLE